ncbi:MAG TPA: hypothetical protein VLV81_08700 [Acidimicrobiia bacterium]|nr:hypothetical protein [Acidimicrobiia bacterium]
MDELERGDNGPAPSWHADALSSTPRVRWWNGRAWTAWVLATATDEAGIAWQPELAELPPPIQWGSPVVRLAIAPPLEITPLAEPPVPDPPASRQEVTAVPVPTGAPPDGTRRHRPSRPRRRRHLLLVSALLPVLAVAGVASAALLTSVPRPAFTDTMAYRDGPAGFSLTYPTGWKIQRVNPGQGIRFVVSARHAPAEELTTVSVTTGSQRGPLPAAADLARTVVTGLRSQFPGITLTTSETTTLAGGPAVLLQLTDPGTNPPTNLEQVVGRTADGRPLTVTIQVPNPRYAPNDKTVHELLASISS